MSERIVDVNCPNCFRPMLTSINDHGFVHCLDCHASSRVRPGMVLREIPNAYQCPCCSHAMKVEDGKLVEIHPLSGEARERAKEKARANVLTLFPELV